MKICLNMIVKNESAILARCLKSVAPFISRYEILDTGSEDDTIEIINRVMSSFGKFGTVHRGKFINYSQARNQALDFCLMSHADFEYVLLADADMELKEEEIELLTRELDGMTDPAYFIRQRAADGSLAYDNIRIISRKSKARYHEPTHEYLSVPGVNVGDIKRLKHAHFIDHQNGSGRKDKYVRDVKLLTEALENDPSNVRSMFYLGQSYREMGQYTEAIDMYQRREDAGGWSEEAWYAKYQKARCILLRSGPGHVAQFVFEMLQAFQMRPSRAEPLYELANHFRMKGQNDLALLFTERARLIPSSQDVLFVNEYQSTVGIREESSITGFYSSVKEIRDHGERDCFDLTIDKKASEWTRSLARTNAVHYARSLKDYMAVEQEIRLDGPYSSNHEQSMLSDGGMWRAGMNPSVFVSKDANENEELKVNLRVVNYTIRPNGSYDFEGKIQTANEILSLCPLTKGGFGIYERKRLVDGKLDYLVNHVDLSAEILGYEDIRPFYHRGSLYAMATVLDRKPVNVAQMALLKIQEMPGHYRIDDVFILPSDKTRREKNWVPLVERSEAASYSAHFDVLYSAEPVKLRAFALDGTELPTMNQPEGKYALEHLRGSSQLISYRGPDNQAGYLFVTHEVIEGSPRKYMHRFCWFNSNRQQITHVSIPFYFREKAIEFCAGLAQMGGHLYVSFGVNDREAWLWSLRSYDVYAFLFLGANAAGESKSRIAIQGSQTSTSATSCIFAARIAKSQRSSGYEGKFHYETLR